MLILLKLLNLFSEKKRPRKEKTLGEVRYNTLFIKKKRKKKCSSTKALPPDSVSPSLKIKKDNFVTLLYASCLDQEFIPPAATEYVWHEENEVLLPKWPIGLALPIPGEVYVENRYMCTELLKVSDKV